MMRKIAAMFVGVLGLGGGMLVMSAPIASAEPHHQFDQTWCEASNDPGDAGADGCWVDNGDDWWVCDIDADGASAWGQMYLKEGGRWVLKGTTDASGNGTCNQGVQVNVLEGRQFLIKICIKASPASAPTYCDNRIGEE